MEILGRKISNKGQQLINSIYTRLNKPVVYEDIGKFGPGAYGAIVDEPGRYVVYASRKLYGEIFETNILHELFHGVQMTNKYPEVVSKINDPLINQICSNISATVLDLEVNDNLSLNGFDSSYFFDERYKILKDLAKRNFDKAQNNILFQKLLTVNLTLCLLTFSENHKQTIIKLFQTAPNNILQNAAELTEIIKQIGHNSSEKCFICFGKILEQLSLWDYFGIKYGKKSIASESHYDKVLNTLSGEA